MADRTTLTKGPQHKDQAEGLRHQAEINRLLTTVEHEHLHARLFPIGVKTSVEAMQVIHDHVEKFVRTIRRLKKEERKLPLEVDGIDKSKHVEELLRKAAEARAKHKA